MWGHRRRHDWSSSDPGAWQRRAGEPNSGGVEEERGERGNATSIAPVVAYGANFAILARVPGRQQAHHNRETQVNDDHGPVHRPERLLAAAVGAVAKSAAVAALGPPPPVHGCYAPRWAQGFANVLVHRGLSGGVNWYVDSTHSVQCTGGARRGRGGGFGSRCRSGERAQRDIDGGGPGNLAEGGEGASWLPLCDRCLWYIRRYIRDILSGSRNKKHNRRT